MHAKNDVQHTGKFINRYRRTVNNYDSMLLSSSGECNVAYPLLLLRCMFEHLAFFKCNGILTLTSAKTHNSVSIRSLDPLIATFVSGTFLALLMSMATGLFPAGGRNGVSARASSTYPSSAPSMSIPLSPPALFVLAGHAPPSLVAFS